MTTIEEARQKFVLVCTTAASPMSKEVMEAADAYALAAELRGHTNVCYEPVSVQRHHVVCGDSQGGVRGLCANAKEIQELGK